MKLSRRKFLVAAPVAAGALLQFKLPALGQNRAPAVVGIDALSRLSWSSFYPFINTDFTFRGSGGREAVLRLTDMVDTRPAGPMPKGKECFLMKFVGHGRSPLVQGTYAAEHFNLGNFDLFITEGGQVGRSNMYFAVINRVTGDRTDLTAR